MKLDQYIENIAPLIQRNYHQKKKKESYDYKMLFILRYILFQIWVKVIVYSY